MRVAICVPFYGDPKYPFVMSLLALQKAQTLAGGFEVDMVTVRNQVIDHARMYLAEAALSVEAEYLLWLDADMAFPRDTLERLISHNLPVVAANYRKRSFNNKVSTAAMLDGEDAYVPIQPKDDGLEEVDVVGFGVCLMKAEVFSGLPQPWFVNYGKGEDAFFFRKLKEAKGIRPVVDHRLSAEVGHVAEAILKF